MRSLSSSPNLAHPRHWLSWCLIVIAMGFAQLPWVLQRAIGAALGAIAWHLPNQRQRIARRNLELCFPELDDAARARLLREHYRELGTGVMEMLRAWWGSVERFRASTSLHGLEELRAFRQEGRGVVLVSGHFMSLELAGRLLAAWTDTAGFYRAYEDPVTEWAVQRGRARYASRMIERDDVRSAVRHLRQGGLLWYAPDQDMRGRDYVFVPFFGHLAATTPATHHLARMGRAVVMTFAYRRRADDRGYELTLKHLPDLPGTDSVADTARVSLAIEAMVRASPANYLWVHARFKRRPPGVPPRYGDPSIDVVKRSAGNSAEGTGTSPS